MKENGGSLAAVVVFWLKRNSTSPASLIRRFRCTTGFVIIRIVLTDECSRTSNDRSWFTPMTAEFMLTDLQCPDCGAAGTLTEVDDRTLRCHQCDSQFPVVAGRPVL